MKNKTSINKYFDEQNVNNNLDIIRKMADKSDAISCYNFTISLTSFQYRDDIYQPIHVFLHNSTNLQAKFNQTINPGYNHQQLLFIPQFITFRVSSQAQATLYQLKFYFISHQLTKKLIGSSNIFLHSLWKSKCEYKQVLPEKPYEVSKQVSLNELGILHFRLIISKYENLTQQVVDPVQQSILINELEQSQKESEVSFKVQLNNVKISHKNEIQLKKMKSSPIDDAIVFNSIQFAKQNQDTKESSLKMLKQRTDWIKVKDMKNMTEEEIIQQKIQEQLFISKDATSNKKLTIQTELIEEKYVLPSSNGLDLKNILLILFFICLVGYLIEHHGSISKNKIKIKSIKSKASNNHKRSKERVSKF